MDLITSVLCLLSLCPLLIVIASAIAITAGKPILFRQWRLGRYGRRFQLIKFRTMTATGVNNSSGLTRDGDSRITRIGRWLRKWKLDELPQLVNVLNGDMTLVGPRPDLDKFWSKATFDDRQVLSLTPGLTGSASIAFRDEERVLAQMPPERLTSFYIEEILPQKAKLDREYAMRANFQSDCWILLKTLLVPVLQHHRVESKSDAQVSR
jgi:lipopolysaccharide/colanic/teichoic acid biosynthesis glycosyltransferase